MRKLIVYFHGYGSNANTDKVKRLRDGLKDAEVFAWDIDIDPDVAFDQLSDHINMEILAEKPLEAQAKLIFVGTSLGGWYAQQMADMYGCEAFLINPAFDPGNSLKKYGVSNEIIEAYKPLNFRSCYHYFIAKDDEVIDFELVREELEKLNTTFVDGAGHRFNGPEFDLVINAINAL